MHLKLWKACQQSFRTEEGAFGNQLIVAMGMLTRRLRTLPETTYEITGSENHHHCPQHPAEMPAGYDERTRRKDQNVDDRIKATIEHRRDALQPVTVPETEHDLIPFSRFFTLVVLHGVLSLIVIALPLISAECRVTWLVEFLQPDIFTPGRVEQSVRQIH